MPYQHVISQLKAHLQQMRHRQLVILSGELEWRLEQLQQLEPQSNSKPGVWIAETTRLDQFNPLAPNQIRHQLGQEVPCAVFCAEDGIDADALGVIAGMIQAGGILWLLVPRIDEWIQQPNPANQRFLSYPLHYDQAWYGFNQRLFQSFQKTAIWLKQGEAPEAYSAPLSANSPKPDGLSSDQTQALAKILQVVNGHRKRPLVIEADRGRGKTTLLGVAAAQLINQGKQHIVLTAARLDQVKLAFKQAAILLELDPDNAQQSGQIQTHSALIEFKAPDELIQNPIALDLLMIDEAAHLPTPMLEALAQTYSRVVFATTLHGYEGSGRGFSLRFKPFLNQHFAGWQTASLQQPIRWADNDPLEQSLAEALLLNCDLAKLTPLDEKAKTANATLDIQHTAIDQLQPDQLQPIFALLVHAHYQTSPADLQQLLSAPGLILVVAYQDQQPVGVMLLTQEGHLPALGFERRVKGHLVPQLLRQATAQQAILGMASERIMRLAVHPERQRQGIGTQLVKAWLTQTAADFVSCSYGATQDLYHFWRQLGFQSVHLGAKRDKSSGTHNLVMIRPVKAHGLFTQLSEHHQAQLPHSLMEFVTRLAPGLQVALLAEVAPNPSIATTQLSGYAQGQQSYESMSHSLWQWTIEQSAKMQHWTTQQQAVWLDKVLRKQAWQTVAQTHQLAGRKGIEACLKQALKTTLDAYKD